MTSSPPVLVCIPSETDIPALVTLYTQLQHPSSSEYLTERQHNTRNSPHNGLLVAELNGQVVGLVAALLWQPPYEDVRTARITALCIDDHYRGRGVGRHLVRAIEQTARAEGCAKIEFLSHRRRTDAHAF